MSLVDQLSVDLVAAMKSKDAARVSALRMLKAALANAEIELRGKGKALDDAAQLAVVKRHAKQLTESIAEYQNGGRADLAEPAAAELRIVEAYLPAVMSEDEVRRVVAAVRAKTGTTQVGPLTGAAMKELQGKVDGAVVRRIVEETLRA